jgi:hypothetical protein
LFRSHLEKKQMEDPGHTLKLTLLDFNGIAQTGRLSDAFDQYAQFKEQGRQGVSVKHIVLHDIADNTGKVARQGKQADLAGIPKNSIFSRPMAATPAAEPMIRIVPPVPAQ